MPPGGGRWALEHFARGDRVGDARRRAQVVLEHLERAVAVAHDVQSGDRDPRAHVLAETVEQRLEVLGAADRALGDDAVAHDPTRGRRRRARTARARARAGRRRPTARTTARRRSAAAPGRCGTPARPSAVPKQMPRSLASRATAALSSSARASSSASCSSRSASVACAPLAAPSSNGAPRRRAGGVGSSKAGPRAIGSAAAVWAMLQLCSQRTPASLDRSPKWRCAAWTAREAPVRGSMRNSIAAKVRE